MDESLKETVRLVKKAKAGEADALNRLLDRYLQRILRIVRMKLGPKLRGRLESMDVVQEVMIRALKGFDNFELKNEAAFLHWISQLVQNEIRDLADYHGAAKRTPDKEVLKTTVPEKNRSVISNLPANSIDRPSVKLRLKEDVLKLEAALDQLEETDRNVIVMRQYEEMSFKDIGEEIGCSENAARMKFGRAMAKLTDLISTDE